LHSWNYLHLWCSLSDKMWINYHSTMSSGHANILSLVNTISTQFSREFPTVRIYFINRTFWPLSRAKRKGTARLIKRDFRVNHFNPKKTKRCFKVEWKQNCYALYILDIIHRPVFYLKDNSASLFRWNLLSWTWQVELVSILT
jgi:hypothetical protein